MTLDFKAFRKKKAEEGKARRKRKIAAEKSMVKRPSGDPRIAVMGEEMPVKKGRPIGDPRAGVTGVRAPAITGRRRKAGIRRKPRLNLGRIPTGDPRAGVMGVRAPAIAEQRRKVVTDKPPRKVGVGREQAKIEPAGLSAKISAIVNSIMAMIFGK